MTVTLKYPALACAVVQAFALTSNAQAQVQTQTQTQDAIASVVVTSSKWIALDRASVGGFAEMQLLDAPSSITSIGQGQMQDLSIRSVTDASRYDASIGDAYNAVGYAEQFSVRGFTLDNATSYRKDMIAISGDTQIALENKERIEILRGLAGLQAGVAAPGGMLNFVTKRPTNAPLRSATVELRERGTVYGALDLGGRFADRRFGYRFNVAAEELKSYVRGADGERQFAAAAFDWHISPDALLQVDIDHQHKAQVTAPGYQLLRNAVLPSGISARTLLNDQPWTRPVDTDSSNLGLRFEYRLGQRWTATVNANKHWFKRDDFTAFPYGCSNEGDGYYPGYCSNGDYDVYDFQSTGERKSPWGAQAMLQGRLDTGALRHALTIGAAYAERHDSFGEYVYDYVGSSNIWQNAIVAPVTSDRVTGPVMERRATQERSLFVQDVLTLAPAWTLHAGVRHVQLKLDALEEVDQARIRSSASFALPNLALVYAPAPDWRVYGSISHGLQYGGIAPMETANQNTVLSPSRSKQLEFGVKRNVNEQLALSGALFQIRQGLEYTNAANLFVRAGQQTHRGIELSAQGRALPGLNYNLSLMALDTDQQDTGEASTEGKRVTNVPQLRSSAWIEYAVPQVAGLKLDAQWQYSGNKAFDPANRVKVPGYHVAGFGASYLLRAAGLNTVIRARLDNAFDKFYWRDVTQSLGGYLLPGAPRTFRLSAQIDF